MFSSPLGNGNKFNEKNFKYNLLSSDPKVSLHLQTMESCEWGIKWSHKYYHELSRPVICLAEHRRSTLTVSSAPRWWTVQGISTMEPTWDVMLVKLVVLKKVVSSAAASLVDNWFELWLLVVFAILNPTPKPLLLIVEFLGLLRLFKFLLESLIELGTVKFPADTLSRSKIFVWFCSTFFGIIRKPYGWKTEK